MKIEQFGCRKTQGIYQEFYVHIFYLNLVSLLGMIARCGIKAKTQHRKWQYTYNWKNAYRFVRERILALLWKKSDEAISWIISRMIISIIPIKPGKISVRDTRNRAKAKINRISQVYKGSA